VCEEGIYVSARVDAKKTLRRAHQICESCQKRQKKDREYLEVTERAELELYLGPHIKNIQEKAVSYREFTDDTVIILQALSALIGPRLMQGTFSLRDCEQLTPFGATNFVDRLHIREVLLDDPTEAPYGTYSVENGKLLIKKSTARYFLPPDINLGTEPGAISEIFDRKFSDADALSNLWLDFAVADVMRYMDYQCSLHNQYFDIESIQKIEDIIRNGLRTYSVAQMWFIMWKVTRDAAALASRTYYSQEKATATIPTKIRKQLEAACQGAKLRNDWSRPEFHIAGSIAMVFNSKFGIDEFTKGDEVIKMFLGVRSQGIEEQDIHKAAAIFIENTWEGQDPLAALNTFATLIRTGLTTENAILELVK
tara:strand:+ start:107 stop:1207 length:1101 start_codon:yes stop_codon:yes gene_type:complete